MIEPIKAAIDGKQISIYLCSVPNAPIVYANMYMEAGYGILSQCKALGCKPFHLVSISNLRWDEELSPWPHEPVVSKDDNFTGEADNYVRFMTERIIPYSESKAENPSRRIIAGYSMGGLFALYAPYITDVFSAAASASGSVWYPQFEKYVKTHSFLKAPDKIYLSLGDTESKTKNPFLCRTEHCMNELLSVYRQKGIQAVFELNPGNHYKDAELRLAKGITWTLG